MGPKEGTIIWGIIDGHKDKAVVLLCGAAMGALITMAGELMKVEKR